ncbi:amino acid ABC transporter permease [Allocoprobacillus halotolerans]|uniref:Amino acid ABC transporter permease n=1 Tax=Allocoprobacillus halotolerans TaxID=2944914 RepID=A0ABY5I398_9FIRM|nr:amino acid ABC transporter permease [Allocoprobacillus halotolerans]UTY38626.1 amino acid ABC transporter permease [Allocoprobacillus halotolerans]
MFTAFWDIMTIENFIYLFKGAMVSLSMAALSLFIGLIFGVLGASAKISKNKFLRILGNIYVEVIRGTPMLLQILLIFNVVPIIITQITGNVFRMDYFLIGVVAMSINSGAYTTELIRSGINGVDKGQWEACETLGLSRWQTMRLVILPQAFKRIVPPLISEFITLIKDSSLVSVIGAVELLNSAKVLGNQYYEFMSPYCIAGVYYLVMTLTISYIAKRLERKLALSD